MHSTTRAIVDGLMEGARSANSMEAALSDQIQKIAKDYRLPKKSEINDAARQGWDLGLRFQSNGRIELTARFRDPADDIERIVTALFNRKNGEAWSYFWSLQGSSEHNFLTSYYPNGHATSFLKAIKSAESAARSSRRNDG